MDNVLDRVFNGLNIWLNGGQCPDANALGECPIAYIHNLNYVAHVAWWPETPPDWRRIAEIVREAGGSDIVIEQAILDEPNGEEDSRGPGGTSLTVTFSGQGADALTWGSGKRLSAAAVRNIKDLIKADDDIVDRRTALAIKLLLKWNEESFDLAAHLSRQREFSRKTFGPGGRTKGVLDHIRKELAEIEANPNDIEEWVDVIILAFDGAWRAGWDPHDIIHAIIAKQTKNEGRRWPDWRTADPEKAIEHDRSVEAANG